MSGPRNVIIIGAGPGGLALALALQRLGWEPAVYERSPESNPQGSGFTLWPNALRALDTLGLGGAVRALGRPLDGIAMHLRTGPELFRIDGVTMRSHFGDSGLALKRSALIRTLLSALAPGRVRFATSCLGLERGPSEVTASFSDGTRASASLLVGADGLRSTIRATLFRVKALRYAGYSVWRGVADLELPCAAGVTCLGQGSQFGFFPMSEGRVYWFGSSNAPQGESDPPEGRKARLLARFQEWQAPVPELIEHTQETCIVRNDIFDMDPLPRWSAGNVTLLGDAAHPATPDMGQGACLAIEDAVVLARSLCAEADLAPALLRYEALRVPRTRAVARLSRMIGRAGTWTNPLTCWARNQMIRRTPNRVRLSQLRWLFEFDGGTAGAEFTH